MTITRSWIFSFATLLVAGLAGLTSVNREAAAQSEQKVLASAEFNNDPNLRCDLLEVKRVSGGALNIRWRIVNTAGGAGGLTGTAGKTIYYTFGWDQLYFIDPAENKKYGFLTDSAGNRILQVTSENYSAGQQRGQWAKFPAPPAASKKITIYIPNFPPFDDIAISE